MISSSLFQLKLNKCCVFKQIKKKKSKYEYFCMEEKMPQQRDVETMLNAGKYH